MSKKQEHRRQRKQRRRQAKPPCTNHGWTGNHTDPSSGSDVIPAAGTTVLAKEDKEFVGAVRRFLGKLDPTP